MNIIKFHRPTLTPLPGFARFSDLQDELDRLFAAPFSGAAHDAAWTPVLDVYEDKENFVVKAELPGLKREEIEVSFQDDTLTISGELIPEPGTVGLFVLGAMIVGGAVAPRYRLPNIQN